MDTIDQKTEPTNQKQVIIRWLIKDKKRFDLQKSNMLEQQPCIFLQWYDIVHFEYTPLWFPYLTNVRL